MSWDIHTATEEWLINFVQRIESEEGMIGGLFHGNRVVKPSEKTAVKYGLGVTPAEAATHDFAFSHVDQSIVRVPRILRFFQDLSKPHRPKGYLFMGYVPGRGLNELDLDVHTDIISRVATIIAHLGQIPGGEIPGPFGGGKPDGYLWGEENEIPDFHSVTDMNVWLNKCLVLRNEAVDLTTHALVLCHMDLCRRNMILGEDNQTIHLIDWGYEGLYPRFFEVATLSCLSPFDGPYAKPLRKATESILGLTDEEKRLIKQMHFVRAASLRYPGL